MSKTKLTMAEHCPVYGTEKCNCENIRRLCPDHSQHEDVATFLENCERVTQAFLCNRGLVIQVCQSEDPPEEDECEFKNACSLKILSVWTCNKDRIPVVDESGNVFIISMNNIISYNPDFGEC